MNDDLKLKLAQKNGNTDSITKGKIISKVRRKYPHLDDEVAILRKALFILVEKVKQQHPDMDLSELEEYNLFVEECKIEAKK